MYRQSHRQAQNTWGQKRFDNLWRFDKKSLSFYPVLSLIFTYMFKFTLFS